MDFRAIGMGVAFALMWSSAFATARVIVADAPPLWALVARFAVSGAVACGLALAMGQSWRLAKGQGRAVVVFGLCQNAAYLGLNFVAMQRVEASVAAIIGSAMPLNVAMLGWLWRRDRIGGLGLAGLAAGFAGVALIMGVRIQAGADPVGVGLCICAAVALAVATLTVRGASGGGNLLMVVGLQMLVGCAALIPLATLTEALAVRWSPPLVAAFAYQVLVPGVLATVLWFRLVGRIGAVRASTFHFLNPIFGLGIAALLLGEHIGAMDLIGAAIAMAGILMVQRARARRV
ncbi:MAG: DMT family transporter [Paracoccaceae bacterium]